MSHYLIAGYDEWKCNEPEPPSKTLFSVDVVMNITVKAYDEDGAKELAEQIARGLKTKHIDYIEVSSVQEA